MDIEKLHAELEAEFEANRLLVTNAFVEIITEEFAHAHPNKSLEILFGNGDTFITIDGEAICPIWGDDAELQKYARLLNQLKRLDSLYTHGIIADHVKLS